MLREDSGTAVSEAWELRKSDAMTSAPGLVFQPVEVDQKELRIVEASVLLGRTLVAASGAKTARFGVPSLVPKWRVPADEDGHYCFAVVL